MRKLQMILSALLLVALLPATASAQQDGVDAQIQSFVFYELDNGPEAFATEFAWPDDEVISAYLDVSVGGYTGYQQYELTIKAFNIETSKQVYSNSFHYMLQPGTYRLNTGEFYVDNLAGYTGLNFVADLTTRIDGVSRATASNDIYITGPTTAAVVVEDFYTYDPVAGVEVDEFYYETSPQAEAVVEFRTRGYNGTRPAGLTFTAFNEAGEMIYNNTIDMRLAPGTYEYNLPKPLALDNIQGRQEVELLATVVVEGVESQTVRTDVILSGDTQATMPVIDFNWARLWNAERERGVKTLPLGEEFFVEAEFAIAGNPAGHEPVLQLVALLEGQEYVLNTDYANMSTEAAREWRVLNSENGTWNVKIGGSLPEVIPAELSGADSFEVRLVVSAANGVSEQELLRATITNPAYSTTEQLYPQSGDISINRSWDWFVKRVDTDPQL